MNKTHDGNFDRTFSPTAEGVAAPLEPTQQVIEDVLGEIGSIALKGLPKSSGYIFYADRVRAELCRLAATVSKNLQEELAKLQKMEFRCNICGNFLIHGNQDETVIHFVPCECWRGGDRYKEYKSRILELEKEIAALKP